jgi:hypothetical protein
MLPADAETRRTAFDLIQQVLSASGGLSEQDKQKLDEIARLFGVGKETPTPRNLAIVESAPTPPRAIAS